MKLPKFNQLSDQQRLLRFLFPAVALLFVICLIVAVTFFSGKSPQSTKPSRVVPPQNDKTFVNSVENSYQQNPELKIVSQMPYFSPDNTFSVDYQFKYDTFYVYLLGDNKALDKQNALSWFGQFGVPINMLKINYY